MRWPWQKAPELSLGGQGQSPPRSDRTKAERARAEPDRGPDGPAPLLGPDRQWEGGWSADPDELRELAALAGERLPPGLLRFLSWSDGGEGPLPVEPGWILLDGAGFLLNTLEDEDLAVVNASLLMIGQGRGGEWIALDMRGGGPGAVVWFDGDLLDQFEAVQTAGELDGRIHRIADDFDALVTMLGRRGP
jgi:hypothetical protein